MNCVECGHVLLSSKGLRQHKWEKHGAGSEPARCDFQSCNFSGTRADVIQHKRRCQQSGKVTCDVCNTVHSNAHALSRHKGSVKHRDASNRQRIVVTVAAAARQEIQQQPASASYYADDSGWGDGFGDARDDDDNGDVFEAADGVGVAAGCASSVGAVSAAGGVSGDAASMICGVNDASNDANGRYGAVDGNNGAVNSVNGGDLAASSRNGAVNDVVTQQY